MDRTLVITALAWLGALAPITVAAQPPASAGAPVPSGQSNQATSVAGDVPVPLAQLDDVTALTRIGYDVFSVDLDALTPGPIDRQYRLSPGDEVHVRVWGQLQLDYLLTVSPDSYLAIPEVPGRVYVSGLALQDVEDRLRRQLATAYGIFFPNLENPAANTAFVEVSLGKVRDVRVLVQGEVGQAGSYALHPSLASVVYALSKAGGVTTGGTLRDIRIRRGMQVISLDFYDLVLRGTLDPEQLRLQDGDIVFVPLKRREVALVGEVRRPGLYTLRATADEDLEAVLDLAGGVLSTANTTRILVRRTTVNVGRQTLSVDLERLRAEQRSFALSDGDIVSVLKTSDTRRDFVQLQGAGALVPGEYQFVSGMRLSDLVQAAGGLAPDAYLARAELRRVGTDAREVSLAIDLRQILRKDPAHDLAVQPLDRLTVLTIGQVEGGGGTVTLRGRVKAAGPVPLASGMRLSDLLFARAGLEDEAFARDIYLPYAEVARVGEGTSSRQLLAIDLRRLLAGDAAHDPVLVADDVVTIFDRQTVLATDRSVTLTGHVKQPGPHALLAGMRVGDLLRSVGGYADPVFVRAAYLPRGEVSRVVGRGDRIERELLRFDLGALLRGDESQNLLLEPDDEVRLYAAADFTEPAYVEISGAVHAGATVALTANMTLEDLLLRAGGLRDVADPAVADLFRTTIAPDGRVVLEQREIALSDRTLSLQHRDRVQVRYRPGFVAERVVEIQGRVRVPGRYSVQALARVSDLVALAGGLVDGAYPEGAEFRRGGETGERVVFDLARALRDTGSGDNLPLADQDWLRIPALVSTVTVEGPDQSLRLAWKKGEGVDYYVAAAGGLPPGTSRDGVRVKLPNGRYAANRFLRGPEVLAGSVVELPRPAVLPALHAAPALNADPPQTATERAAPATTEPPGAVPPATVPPATSTAAIEAPPATAVGGIETFTFTPDRLSGGCPTRTMDVEGRQVQTSAVTVFVDGDCAALRPGQTLEIRGVRLTATAFHALEIRRKSP